ncbi:MAG: cytochrome c family protein [Sphingomonadales bacterium]
MNSFEWNKIAGGVLAAVLVVIVIYHLGVSVFKVEPLEQQAYIVEGVVEEETPAPTAEAPADDTEPLAVRMADASLERGERVFRRCAACHSVNPADGNRAGPNLYDVVGKSVPARTDFNYSSAMQNYDGDWSFESLDAYLTDPRGYLPGTNMAFAGLRRAQERADIIVFLNQNADDPLPLPEVQEAEEVEELEDGEPTEQDGEDAEDPEEVEEDPDAA